jgi:hypothetical protein
VKDDLIITDDLRKAHLAHGLFKKLEEILKKHKAA